MSSNDPKCKGCISYNVYETYLQCVLPSSYEGNDCPCLTCLVKGVCKEFKKCNLFIAYIEYYKFGGNNYE